MKGRDWKKREDVTLTSVGYPHQAGYPHRTPLRSFLVLKEKHHFQSNTNYTNICNNYSRLLERLKYTQNCQNPPENTSILHLITVILFELL